MNNIDADEIIEDVVTHLDNDPEPTTEDLAKVGDEYDYAWNMARCPVCERVFDITKCDHSGAYVVCPNGHWN